jgi:hypothetical protein
MVRRTTIHKFVTENGYQLIEKYGKSETSRMLKLSRPTLDRLLKQFPQAPARTIPKYVFAWEETEGNKVFAEKYQGLLRHYRRYVRIGMRAWLLLDKKDPVSWDLEEYRKLWKDDHFRDQSTGRINFLSACVLRKWMVATGKSDLCKLEEFGTKRLKRPKGLKKQWFLEDDEITRLIEATEGRPLLVGFVVSLLGGGRASSAMPRTSTKTKGIRPIDVDDRNNGILMFEPKRQEYVLRLFHPKVIELLKRYIADEGIKPNEPCFPEYNSMRDALNETAERAKVSKLADMVGCWHITKHTFVSQGAYHGLSLEVLSEQTGTDANTLMEFYAGMKEKKMRLELLGEKVEIEPFHEWALRVIIDPAVKRYEAVKREFR